MKRLIIQVIMFVTTLTGPIAAEDYPSRPVKLVLPQPAGGAVALIARTLADRLAEQFG
jgi:tripartite-type tricarboxylate transporter receptor subunit TctC